MNALIAVDDWKLPIFRHALEKAGYKFKEGPGLHKDTTFMSVDFTDGEKLYQVVKGAQERAATMKDSGSETKH